MIYDKALTIPAETKQPSLASVELAVGPGVVKQVFLTFPDGCAGLVGVQILFAEHVVWPSNPDTFFIANDITFSFLENTKVDDEPYSFTMQGYNNDCVYPHTVTLRLSIVPDEPSLLSTLLARGAPVGIVDGAIIE